MMPTELVAQGIGGHVLDSWQRTRVIREATAALKAARLAGYEQAREEAAQVVEHSKMSVGGFVVRSNEAEKAFTGAFKDIAAAIRSLKLEQGQK